MGNPTDFYDVLNIPKHSTPDDVRKAYKALVRKWHPDKHPPPSKPLAETMFKSISEAYEALSGSTYRTVFGAHNSADGGGGGGGGGSSSGGSRWASPSPRVRPQNQGDDGSTNGRMPRTRSVSAMRATGHYSRSTTTNGSSWGQEAGGSGPLPRSTSARRASSFYTTSTATTTSPATGAKTNTMFFQKKPPPIEKTLDCTLEELFRGCKKEVRFTRDVIGKNGTITKKEEVEMVKVKPGWKKGTKVTFEEKGDERPGSLPSDVIFLISEKDHPYFKRVGNDLILKIDITLVNALTGWIFSFRTLSGEKMTCRLDGEEVISPGYEKVIEGEGMPVPNQKGVRGDLIIKFNVVFPKKLSKSQRSGLKDILKNKF